MAAVDATVDGPLRVVHRFRATGDGHIVRYLDLEVGDLVFHHLALPNGWYYGELCGNRSGATACAPPDPRLR